MNARLLAKRSRYLSMTREFFTCRGYLEVETPILAPYLIPEPSIEVFRTEHLHRGGVRESYLIPSPELWMKRLLAQGSGDIFQITKSFRNLEFLGPYHNPEFTLLEWYTVGHGYLDSIGVLEAYLGFLSGGLDDVPPWRFPLPRMTMREAFAEHARLDLDDMLSLRGIRHQARRLGLEVHRGASWEELFNGIFLARVEPRLSEHEALVLLDYPAAVPTTAKSRNGYAERWELYMKGVEIANCYSEETSSPKLRRFIERESERKRGCRIQHRVDRGLAELASAGSGLPECSGTALGMDRLFMVICGAKSIDKVILFPFSETG